MSLPRFRLTSGFDDPACTPDRWQHLLERSPEHTINQTREFLLCWWETLGIGQLLLAVAEQGGETITLAPLYATGGMIFFLGSGESDTLDLIGDGKHLPELLKLAIDAVPEFVGVKLYLMPESSDAGAILEHAAQTLALSHTIHNELNAYDVDLRQNRAAIETTTGRSMKKREDAFRARGEFAISRDCTPRDLEAFFEQHARRWEGKEDYQSPYALPEQRRFFERWIALAAERGWLRFLRLDFDRKPLGFAFAFYYGGTHYSGPWSFDREQARHCPGHVLLRHSLLRALEENLCNYDLRGGDDHYKDRLPTQVRRLHTHGLYPL